MKFDIATVLELPNLPSHLERVEQAMMRVVIADNPALERPIIRLLRVRGKRLRPSLVIAAAGVCSHKIDANIIVAAAAIELLHLASLIHDDIIDEACTRWNIPTINAQEGLGSAIISGDYLLAKACQLAASISGEAAELVATTFAGLCDGQAREMAEAFNVNRSVDAYFAAIRGKTATLVAAACRIGALCAGAPSRQIEALGHFGQNFGMAFQLIDDLLDFLSTPELAGKPIGTDVHEGVYTLPLLLSLAGPNGPKLRKLLKQDPKAVHTAMVEILLRDGSAKETLVQITKYDREAGLALHRFGKMNKINGLKNLPGSYLDWALQNLIASQYKSVLPPPAHH